MLVSCSPCKIPERNICNGNKIYFGSYFRGYGQLVPFFFFFFGPCWGRMLGLEDFVKPKYLHSNSNERNRANQKQIASFIAFLNLQWSSTSYFLPSPGTGKESITGLHRIKSLMKSKPSWNNHLAKAISCQQHLNWAKQTASGGGNRAMLEKAPCLQCDA